MLKQFKLTNQAPYLILAGMTIFIIFAFFKGNLLVSKSEKELSQEQITTEAKAQQYTLKEIDVKTGELRWKLTAKGGETQEHLQSALIKDIEAKVYKNNEVVFELQAPFAKADASTKEIFLFGNVLVKNNDKSLLLMSSQIALGMNASIEAQKGFDLELINTATIKGETASINEDQTQIIVHDLSEAVFKDISLSGNEVTIIKDKNGSLQNVEIKNGGKIILTNQDNDNLSANTINWKQNGEIEATNNVIFISKDKVFKSNYLLLKQDKTLYARDNVLITHHNTKCYGNSLTYDNKSLITISGKPKAIQEGKQITADKIVYDLTTGKVQAIGNVKTSIEHSVERLADNR